MFARRELQQSSWRSRRGDFTVSEARHVIRERRRLVAGVMLALTVAAVILGFLREPSYTAEAVVVVEPRRGFEAGAESEMSLQDITRAVSEDRGFMAAAADRAGWEEDAFGERLEPVPASGAADETRLLVHFSGPTAAAAEKAANAYAEVFVERVNQLGGERLAGGTLGATASLEKKAVVPEALPGVRLLPYAAGGLVLGAVIGSLFAVALEPRSRLWRGVRDAEATLRVPVLGAIPEYGRPVEEE